MKFSHEIKDGVWVVTFEENLISPMGIQELLDLADENIIEEIKLCAADLSKMQYINSSGIGILTRLLVKFRNKGGEMILVKPCEKIYKLLIITKLSAIFTIAEDVSEAVKILKS